MVFIFKFILKEHILEKYDLIFNKGHEYAYMLNNIDKYCKIYNFQKFSKKEHPENIYICPESIIKF